MWEKAVGNPLALGKGTSTNEIPRVLYYTYLCFQITFALAFPARCVALQLIISLKQH